MSLHMAERYVVGAEGYLPNGLATSIQKSSENSIILQG